MINLNAKEVIGIKQRTNPWLDAKLGRLSGTRIAASLDIDRFKSYDQLMDDMLAEVKRGSFKAMKMNSNITRGNDFEDPVRQEGIKKFFVNSNTSYEVSQDDSFWLDEQSNICYSPDGLVVCDGIRYLVEVKCPNRIFENGVPPWHQPQINLGMEMLKCEKTLFIQGEVANNKLVRTSEVVYDRDPTWWEEHSSMVGDFLDEFNSKNSG